MILRLTEFDEVLLFARNGHICKHASAQRKIVKDQKASVKKKTKNKIAQNSFRFSLYQKLLFPKIHDIFLPIRSP